MWLWYANLTSAWRFGIAMVVAGAGVAAMAAGWPRTGGGVLLAGAGLLLAASRLHAEQNNGGRG